MDASTSTTGLALAVLAGSTGLVDLAGGVTCSARPSRWVGTAQAHFNSAMAPWWTRQHWWSRNSLGSGTVAVDGDAAVFGGALHSALSIAGAVSIGKNGPGTVSLGEGGSLAAGAMTLGEEASGNGSWSTRVAGDAAASVVEVAGILTVGEAAVAASLRRIRGRCRPKTRTY